jgi:hypothetical protein
VRQLRIGLRGFEQSFPSYGKNPGVLSQSLNGVTVVPTLFVSKNVAREQELQDQSPTVFKDPQAAKGTLGDCVNELGWRAAFVNNLIPTIPQQDRRELRRTQVLVDQVTVLTRISCPRQHITSVDLDQERGYNPSQNSGASLCLVQSSKIEPYCRALRWKGRNEI